MSTNHEEFSILLAKVRKKRPHLSLEEAINRVYETLKRVLPKVVKPELSPGPPGTTPPESLPDVAARKAADSEAYLRSLAARADAERGPRQVDMSQLPTIRELVAKYRGKGMTLEDATIKAFNKVRKETAKLVDRETAKGGR